MRRLGFPFLAAVLVVSAGVAPVRAQDDDLAEAFYRSGTEALAKNNYAAGVFNLERSLEMRPDNVDAWRKLGMAQSALRHWDAALRAYGKALELDPEDAKTHHNIGNVYFRKGDTEAAAEAYRRSLEIDPDYLLAAFHYGWTLRQLNRAEEAERAFRHCLELSAGNERERGMHADCMFGFASLRYRAKDYEEAAKGFEQVLEFYPEHPEARYYLGLSYRQLGRKEEAKEQLEIHRKLMKALRARTEVIEAPEEP